MEQEQPAREHQLAQILQESKLQWTPAGRKEKVNVQQSQNSFDGRRWRLFGIQARKRDRPAVHVKVGIV